MIIAQGKTAGAAALGKEPNHPTSFVTVQVWGRPPVCRFTESLTPCPSGRRNTGPEARFWSLDILEDPT